MFGAFSFIAFHWCFHRLSAAAPLPDPRDSPWFIGCVNAGDGPAAARRVRDLDPVNCCVRCLDEGFLIAALNSESCYCGNQLHGLEVSECFNTSVDVRGESEEQRDLKLLHLPVGGSGHVALYRTQGPFLHHISLSTSPERVHAGKPFVLVLSGHLAARPDQPTGIEGFRGQNLSYVTAEFLQTASTGQSSQQVSVLADGSFAAASDWMLETSGTYEIKVSVSNPVSKLSSTLDLSVLQPLVITLLHGPLGVPSCIPSPELNSQSGEAYVGDAVTLQAHVADGRAPEFYWCFTQGRRDENKDEGTDVKTTCLPKTDGRNSSVTWTFTTEGIHTVSVNASGDDRWTQEMMHIVVVRHAVSDLKVDVNVNQLSAGASIPVVVELLSTMKHLLLLNVTLNADYNYGHEHHRREGAEGCDHLHSDDQDDDCKDRSHGNSHVKTLIKEHNNIYCHGETYLHQHPAGLIPLHLHHTSNRSSCHLHLHLHCRLPTNAGKYHLTASVFSLPVNATSLYRNSDLTAQQEATVALFFNQTGTVVVELRAENQASSQNKSVTVCVEGKRKPSAPNSQRPVLHLGDNAVRIHAASRAYPTNTAVTFVAVADVTGPVEFLWYFGDSRSTRTTSRTVTRRYHTPGRYDVVVVVSGGRTPLTSEVFPLVVQRAVKLNRLVHQASVLRNRTVALSCRVNVGTDLIFLWSFGDGTTRFGQSTEQHVFHRTGEFRVEVTVSNLVSSASLSSLVFVVDRPCQPPPVKNMGPLKLQVRRYEVLRLGVTYEAEVDCDITRGLRYTWTLLDSAGRLFPLTLTDSHRQSLVLPSHLLQYDTYTATARVQVVGSVVYSNYSVRVQVMPSPPLASIQGGTNVFVNNRNTDTVTLDGRRSYNPDFPMNPISFHWTCEPVSSVTSSCFNQHVSTSSAVLTFPLSSLKHNFDQFRFQLDVHSGGRSASSESFVTVTSSAIGKVAVYCPQCQGDLVNWDQSFSVSASCEDCGVSPQHIRYTWSLYQVNASSKPVVEVPFCYTVDLSAPSTIVESPSTSDLRPPLADASRSTRTVQDFPPVSLTEEINTRTEGSGEESFHHPLEEPLSSSTEDPPLDLDNDLMKEFHIDSDSSADWAFSFPARESVDPGDHLDYDVPFLIAEEGDPGVSAGRPTGVDGETLSPGDGSMFDPASHDNEGSNLVDSSSPAVIREPTLLDLPRHPVDRGMFESYTLTGLSSPLLSFRPFGLRPGSRYMLEVTANSQSSFLGRTQLFLKTNPAPKGMTCQVQPRRGTELYTHFSIFCTSGREDLLYEYSFSVGNRPPRILYHGPNFQYYFNLPSGDRSDDCNVTIYIKIRSSTYGTSTELCPITVQVQPSLLRDVSSPDPDLELSESGLKNLSALVRLGNRVEICNYISLLSGILNRLSRDAEANTDTQKRVRSVLICTVCELESSEQASMEDSICILKDLLQVTSQVTLASVRRVTVHVQAISEQLPASRDQKTLNTLVGLLSYSLQVVVDSRDLTLEKPNTADAAQEMESGPPAGERDAKASLYGCTSDSNSVFKTSISTQQVVQLTDDILQTASDLILKYILFPKIQESRVDTGLMSLYATYQNQTSTVVSSGSATFFMPASLVRLLFARRGGECVLSLLTELTHSPYIWARGPDGMCGPVVDLSLHTCSTRRKIPVRSLVLPIIIELQLTRRQKTSLQQHALLRSRVNYHSFNVTQEHLQQAIQLTVAFTRPPNKTFPIMLLFRMFEKPTPSMHHLLRIHRWESNTTRITLAPSYLNAAGVGYLALLNADFMKPPRHNHLSKEVHYSLTVESSQCISWDGHQGAWTHLGCRIQQADRTAAVNCSCHHMKPLTVVQQAIQSSNDTGDLDPFLSASSDLTVVAVLLLCVCLYIPALVVCRRADVTSEGNRRVHYLSDNSPRDTYQYAVTIHTGLSSPPSMSAKVYIVLYGEDSVSQTRELHVPGCSLFRRNSQDTFILSSADSLGSVWGVHIWHDNTGPSPNWYLKLVEVSEVSRADAKGRTWLFVSQSWLAGNKGDGRVERMLRVCTQGTGLAKTLCLKLFDYLADFHIWISVRSCPSPTSFTHTQRLNVCLLLLAGYACVNAVIISQMEEPLPFEFGVIAASAVSVTTGVLSVAAVLPAATLISLLFRLREVKLTGSGMQHAEGRKTDSYEDSISEAHLSWSHLHQWAQEAWRKKYQGTGQLSASMRDPGNKGRLMSDGDKVDRGCQRKELDCVSESSRFHGIQTRLQDTKESSGAIQREMDHQGKCPTDVGFNGGSFHQAACSEHGGGFRVFTELRGRRAGSSQWCHYLAWALCLLLSLVCLVLSAVLGLSFSSSKALLWIHSLFFSLLLCVFLIQPAVILAVAVTVSLWFRNTPDFHRFSRIKAFELQTLEPNDPEEQFSSAIIQDRRFNLEKLLGARQRARYLRFVRPPTLAELRQSHGRKGRDTFMHETLRDFSLGGAMLFLMLCVMSGNSFSEYYDLNKAVRQQFIGKENTFMSIQKYEDWWKWTETSLLNLVYKDASATMEFAGILQSHTLIGEPILWKRKISSSSQCQESGIAPECLRSASTYPHSDVFVPMATPPKSCSHLCCNSGPSTTVGLGHTKSEASFKLKVLRSDGWLCRETVASKLQFTLYSPAPNLFTTVSLFAEQSPTGALLHSAKVQSVRVYHSPTVWDYVVMVCQLLFLLLSLLHLCLQVCTAGQQGLTRYCRTPCNWLEVTLLTVTLVYYAHYIYHSVVIVEVVELLQRHNNRGHVDISLLATREQCIRSLGGVLLFLLTLKCVTVLRVNSTTAASATLISRSLFMPTISSIVMMVALSSLQTLLRHYQEVRDINGRLLSGHHFLNSNVFCLSSIIVWTAVITGVVSTSVRNARRPQNNKGVCTLAKLTSYVRRRVCQFTGLHRPRWPGAERRTYYLEEFESLVDELLFRLNALSGSLHHTLPPKAYQLRDDSPVTSLAQEPTHTDSQGVAETNLTELVNVHTDINDHRETTPASHLLRVPVQRSQRKDGRSSDNGLLYDNSQESVARVDEGAKSKAPENFLWLPESPSPVELWTVEHLERGQPASQSVLADVLRRTEKRDSFLLNKSGKCRTEGHTTTHTEVEVQVHEEPGTLYKL